MASIKNSILGKSSILELAVLIPAYNEEQTIRKVVEDCLAATKEIKACKVFVYNNNSTDSTGEILNAIRDKRLVVKNCLQQGKGLVIRRAFREISARCVVMLDADETYPAEDIPKLYKKLIDNELDMVIGDRLSSSYFTENKRAFHNFGNTLIRKAINTFFHADIKDILTGFRAFSYTFTKTCPILSSGFSVETEMSIYAIENRMTIANEVIEYKDRPAGSESKLSTFSDGFKALNTIFQLYRSYHPFALFGTASLITALFAGIFATLRCFLPYLETGLVLNIPTLIVCGLAFIAATLAFFAGLILDSIVKQNKREFELLLNQWRENEKNNNSN